MLVEVEIIEEIIKIVDLIRKRMKEVQDRQLYIHIRPLEFEVGDHKS